MSSFVYNPYNDALTYLLNGDNLYTQFIYDSEGRLVETRQEMFQYGAAATGSKLLTRKEYHYARYQEANDLVAEGGALPNDDPTDCVTSNQPITATLAHADQVLKNTPVNFTVNSAETGLALNYNFGDGTTLTTTATTVSHNYTTAGNYSVSVTASKNCHTDELLTGSLTAYDQPYQGDLCVNGPVATDLCGPVPALNGSCTDPGSNKTQAAFKVEDLPGSANDCPLATVVWTYHIDENTVTRFGLGSATVSTSTLLDLTQVSTSSDFTVYPRAEVTDQCGNVYYLFMPGSSGIQITNAVSCPE